MAVPAQHVINEATAAVRVGDLLLLDDDIDMVNLLLLSTDSVVEEDDDFVVDLMPSTIIFLITAAL